MEPHPNPNPTDKQMDSDYSLTRLAGTDGG